MKRFCILNFFFSIEIILFLGGGALFASSAQRMVEIIKTLEMNDHLLSQENGNERIWSLIDEKVNNIKFISTYAKANIEDVNLVNGLYIHFSSLLAKYFQQDRNKFKCLYDIYLKMVNAIIKNNPVHSQVNYIFLGIFIVPCFDEPAQRIHSSKNYISRRIRNHSITLADIRLAGTLFELIDECLKVYETQEI